MTKQKSLKTTLRLRIGQHEAHYAGQLVDGARILQLFGDAATEVLIRLDGDEGLFRAYETIEFLAPVYAGDYLEVSAELLEVGKSSRKISFEAKKVISLLNSNDDGYKAPSSAQVHREPILVCKAVGTCVTPKDLQREG